MPLAAELQLPGLDHTDPSLEGDGYRSAMAACRVTTAGWPPSRSASPCSTANQASSSCAPRTGLTVAELFQTHQGSDDHASPVPTGPRGERPSADLMPKSDAQSNIER